ncbi:unnamed protein product [Sphagnum troendelagicum]
MEKSVYSRETNKKVLRRGFDAGQGREKEWCKKGPGFELWRSRRIDTVGSPSKPYFSSENQLPRLGSRPSDWGKSSREERKHRVNRAKDDMGLMPRMVCSPRGESSLVIHVVCQSWMKTELASWHGELPAWPLKFSTLGQEGFGPWGI